MRQVAAAVVLALLASAAAPVGAQDSTQGLRDALDANTAERTATDAALAPDVFLTDDELDKLVAPVALYPDALLAQVLVASTFPLQVVEADRIIKQKDQLTEDELAERLKRSDWDPSVTVLASGFPTVIERMSDDLEWTEKLGDAMLNQDDDILSAVQRMREEAKSTGYLADNAAQVIEEDQSGTIAIKPADPKVVYVPTYDPDVVYTSRPTAQPYIAPVTQAQSPIANPLIAGALAFGGALLVQELFGNDDNDHHHNKNNGWEGYWDRDRPIDWRDRQFYPRPVLYGQDGYRGRSWGSERDRYWDPQDRRWRRDTLEARRDYDAQRRDALGWLVVDDPASGRPVVRAYRSPGTWTAQDERLRRIAQREADQRQQAVQRADRLENRVEKLQEDRRADALAAQRREARLKAAAAAAQQEAKASAAQASRDAKARAAAERAKARADAKAAAAQQAAADARAKAAADRNAAAEAKAKQARDEKARQAAADAKAKQAAADQKQRQAQQDRRQAGQEGQQAAQQAREKQQAQDAKAKQAAEDRAQADARAKQAQEQKARQARDAKARQAQDAKAKQAQDAKAKAAADSREKQQQARQKAAAQQKAADAKAKQAAEQKAAFQKAAQQKQRASQQQASQQKAAQQKAAQQKAAQQKAAQQKAAQQKQAQQKAAQQKAAQQQAQQKQAQQKQAQQKPAQQKPAQQKPAQKKCRPGDKNCQNGGGN